MRDEYTAIHVHVACVPGTCNCYRFVRLDAHFTSSRDIREIAESCVQVVAKGYVTLGEIPLYPTQSVTPNHSFDSSRRPMPWPMPMLQALGMEGYTR